MPDPLLAFARLCHEGGELAQAEQAYRRLLDRDPLDAEVNGLMGALRITQGRAAEAIVFCEIARNARPDHAPTLANLGMALREVGRLADAEQVLRQAHALDPTRPAIAIPLAQTWGDLGRLAESIALLRQVIQDHPRHATAWNDLGARLQQVGQGPEAADCFREAVRLDPGFPRAHSNLGTAWQEQGRLDEAVAAYDQALRLAPDDGDARWNRATARLLAGDLPGGWADFRARWAAVGQSPPRFAVSEWDGSSLNGQTLLIHAEQGLGDTLQFVRYAPLVAHSGGRVVLACQGALAQLSRRTAGIAEVVPFGSPLPGFDHHIALMDLPGMFGTTLETIPRAVPYLFARPDLREIWSRKLPSGPALRIGVAWQGRPDHPRDRQRSFALNQLSPLTTIPGVRWFSLQHGHGLDQLDRWGGSLGINDLGLGSATIEETAAAVAHLDLVVTPDSAIAHLAGGLGRPTWLALPHAPDWRWLRDRDDSPWYPTLRLFRQPSPGDWETVFQTMARELVGWAGQARRDGGNVPASPTNAR